MAALNEQQVRVGRRQNAQAVYIGRGSPLGNPFAMRDASDAERDRVCAAYEQWFAEQLAAPGSAVQRELARLRELAERPEGVTLGCFCAPKRCHGDTVRRYLLDPETFHMSTQPESSARVTADLERLPRYTEGQGTRRYAGIGSRSVPPDMQERITRVAAWLARAGYTLRTGDAAGSDAAFRAGVEQVGGALEVYTARDADDRTRAIARAVHPAPQRLKPFALDLMARNAYQVFGRHLDTPVDFILFWTPDGVEDRRPQGGTGQAVELGLRSGIPVVNMARAGWEDRLRQVLGMPPRIEAAMTRSESGPSGPSP